MLYHPFPHGNCLGIAALTLQTDQRLLLGHLNHLIVKGRLSENLLQYAEAFLPVIFKNGQVVEQLVGAVSKAVIEKKMGPYLA